MLEPTKPAPRRDSTLLVSLDCEGKWGVADKLPANQAITNQSLLDVYQFIIRELEAAGIMATFAFVGLFAGGRGLVDQVKASLIESAPHHEWLRSAFGEHDASLGGWDGSEIVMRLRGTGHELASHSFTHIPFNDFALDDDAFELEMNLMREWGSCLGLTGSTLVFPRNQVRHVDQLLKYGIRGYRELKAGLRPRALGRLSNLGGEFNLLARSQGHATPTHIPVPIPSGHMLNWPRGGRRMVPGQFTKQRWRSMLRHAVTHGRVAHLWLHPHNLITAPSERELLSAVFAECRALIASGDLQSMTQEQYVEAVI